MSSLKTIRELEEQIECVHQHLEDLWDNRNAAIKEFISNHPDWIRVNSFCTSASYHYFMAPEMKIHLVDYTHKLLSKERGFSREDAKKLVKDNHNLYHNLYLENIILKGELVPKHLMLRYLNYLKKEHPNCVLDMLSMVEIYGT